MSTPITETAPQFIAKAMNALINKQGEAKAGQVVDELIGGLYPGVSAEDACHQLIVNAVDAKIKDAILKSDAEQREWVRVGQLDLFGSGEFKIPPSFLPKSIAETDAFMSDRAIAEQDAADTLAKAWKAQQDKAARVEQWSVEVHRLRLGVEAAGMNPSEVSVEQAIKQAEAVQPGYEVGFGQKAKRPLRVVRPPADR